MANARFMEIKADICDKVTVSMGWNINDCVISELAIFLLRFIAFKGHLLIVSLKLFYITVDF